MSTQDVPANHNDKDDNLPPAIRLPLSGRHLIEASAGTGKTWTLTGVVLRLIVEAGYPCDKIIATTFTRSAAAEMRQRIRERLQDFYRLLRLVMSNSYAAALMEVTPDEQPQALYQWLKDLVAQTGDKLLTEAVGDPINQHLIKYIATQMFEKPAAVESVEAESDNTTATDTEEVNTRQTPPKVKASLDFRIALQRTSTALNQLDRLFVSTLDSLCQKWLREFSSETGFSPDVQISSDVQPIVISMIHDQLRAFWAEVHRQEPEVYQLMQANKKLYSADTYAKVVERAMNFYTAPIDNLTIEPLDLDSIQALMKSIVDYQIDAHFQPYFDEAYRLSVGFAKYSLHKNFDGFYEVQAGLANQRLDDLLNLSKTANDFINAVQDSVENGKGFRKGFEVQWATFTELPIIQAVNKLAQVKAQIDQHIDQLNAYFTQFISRYVRDNLPKVLEAQRLTTFTLQLARLNQALQGRQGASLARYIRHQYPVALIDESQDINTEQALLIERIYLNTQETNNHPKPTDASEKAVKENLFLLLVGDPKQAIYGFRGGDVHNYTTLKKLFNTQPMSLTRNRRSAKALIDSLNGWYGNPDEIAPDTVLDNNQPYFLGEEIEYKTISATRDKSDLQDTKLSAEQNSQLPAMYHINFTKDQPLPGAVLHGDDDVVQADSQQDDAEDEVPTVNAGKAIAAQILALFDPDYGQFMLEQRPLSLSDICVLAAKNTQLTEVERALHQQGIATLRGGSQSVFADVMAQDLLTLMAALLAPYHKSKLKTLLLSKFFRLTLTQANQLFSDTSEVAESETDTRQYRESINWQQLASQITELLVSGGERWQKDGFLAAIQWLLTQKLSLPDQPAMQTFWQRLASDKDGERLLIDLRQLLDIISELWQGQRIGEYQLYEWYATQVQTAPKEEWCLQHRLPSEEGVQLMTIHGSKGLEFPIVFVVGLENSVTSKSNKATLYLYSAPKVDGQISLLSRRLSPVASRMDENIEWDFKNIELQSTLEEKLRLMYVALTRARERLYIVTKAPGSNSSNNPLAAFVADIKSLTLKPKITDYVASVNLNSLSKYFSQEQNFSNYQTQQPTTQSTPIDYQHNINTIKKADFKGWANTSFTALSRYVNQQRYDMAVHEPDYDGLDDSSNLNNDAEMLDSQQEVQVVLQANLPDIKGLWLPKIPLVATPELALEKTQPLENVVPTFDNVVMQSQPISIDFISHDLPPNWHQLPDSIAPSDRGNTFETEFDAHEIQQSWPPYTHEPIPDMPVDDMGTYPMTEPMDDVWLNDNEFEPVYEMDYTFGTDDAADILLDSIPAVLPYPEQLSEGSNFDERQLLRFRFEKGASAGTFLHKVLEDLANSHIDDSHDTQSTYAEGGVGEWQPPARWAILVDRALRRQQLPNQYYSNILASEGKVANQVTDVEPEKLVTQPEYLALTQWLNEVIHTPLHASGQRPSDIKMHHKTAEMGFNMRLSRSLSLAALNQLFASQGIELNLQQQMSQQSLWRYLRGEIDLVYEHEGRYYVVDYKSNYLGNTFDAYHTAALAQSMSEHRYWLQAAIYQVALHRFLQLRLPHYDINTHLGAVEYAFIRGMSPNYVAHGRLVWQPDSEFILALDALFGADIDFS